MEVTARIHHENGSYWADVVELPGVFAAGVTPAELLESLREGIALYLDADGIKIEPTDPAALSELHPEVEELKLAVPA